MGGPESACCDLVNITQLCSTSPNGDAVPLGRRGEEEEEWDLCLSIYLRLCMTVLWWVASEERKGGRKLLVE